MKIVLLGYIVRGPLGGLVWHHFQYLYGLHQMGHKVLFLEESEEYAACYNPETYQMTTDPTYGLNFIMEIFSKFNLQNHWAYFDYHTNQWFGQSEERVMTFIKDADIVLNLSGINPLRDWILPIPKKVFIDTDPVFTQVKHLSDPAANQIASMHDAFFTFGENYGEKGCTIPIDGFSWLPTRQPVVMELWNNVGTQNNGKWTTVMQWDSYKTQRWKGKAYGMKSKSFDEFIELPQKCSEKFELALGSNSAPNEMLTSFGWQIINPLLITKTPYSYQDYIKKSKGEWSVAKHGYVSANSGWFSERTLNYMASGKPVVVQETGFSEFLPVGEGLLSFSTKEEATEALLKVNTDYNKHCKTARQIVNDYFGSRSVLQSLLDRIT